MNAALIIPARDEEECIASVIEDARRHFRGLIVVVDNGSRDRTAQRAVAAGARVVAEPVPGYGRACMAGARAAASCEVLVFMDADGSDCPEDISALLASIAAGADVALGVRRGERVEPGSVALAARFGNWLSGALIGIQSGVRPRDMSPLKAIRRSTLEAISPREMTYGWTVELIAVAASRKLPIAQVETGYRHRAGGTSKVSGNLSGSLWAGYRILLTLGRVAMNQVTPVGFGAVAGLLCGLALLGAFSAWLVTQAPSSRGVLVTPWLLGWPVLLLTVSVGMGVGALVRRWQGAPE